MDVGNLRNAINNFACDAKSRKADGEPVTGHPLRFRSFWRAVAAACQEGRFFLVGSCGLLLYYH